MTDFSDLDKRSLAGPPWPALLIIALLFVYLPFIFSQEFWAHTYIKGDSYYYRAAIISLLEDGDLLVANNVSYDPLSGQLAVGQAGLVPKHPILLSLLALPFYLVAGTPGLLLFNLFMTLLLMVLLLRFNQLFMPAAPAFVVTFLYGVATLFFNYAYNFSPDILSTLLLLGGLYLLFRERTAYAAVLLGLSIFAKPLNLLPVGLIGLYFLWMQINRAGNEAAAHRLTVNWRNILLFAGCFALGLLPFLVANYLLFGLPWVTGYQRIAVAGALPGEIVLSSHVNHFNQPLLPGLYYLLFHPNKGLLTTNPLLLLAIPGLFNLLRAPRRPELVLLAVISGAMLLLMARYDYWYTSHFSNRFLMLTVALSAPFTGWTIQRLARKYGALR